MPLQIWMPLNGTLENRGCYDMTATNHGATVETYGKIGKCYYFNNAYINGNLNLTENISFAFWLKLKTIGSKHVLDVRDSGGNGHQPMYMTATTFQTGGNGNFVNGSFAWEADKWYHIAVVYEKITASSYNVKFYINNEKKLDKTASATIPTGTKPFYLCTRYNQQNYADAYMNDFRVYDHCLSETEIHKLSQGLVLHYRLTGVNDGINENLMRETPSVYYPNSYQSYSIHLTENLVANQTYTIQFWDVDVTHTGRTENNIGLAFYWGGGTIQIKNFSGTTWFTNGHADYLHHTFTPTEAQASRDAAQNAWFNIYNSVPSATGDKYMHIGRWKLEKGSVGTPYIPANIDSGVDDTIVYDESGYGNNGTTYGTPELSPLASPRYNSCTYFKKADAINCGRGGMVTDSITVNLWVNYATWDRPVSCTESGGWNFEGTTIQFALYIYGVGYLTSKNGYATAPARPSANEWHMITGTYDRIAQTTSIYIDGELEDTKATDTSNRIGYNANNVIWLAAEAGGNASAPASSSFSGSISDFRIYCTALSAEDIRELYQTSMKIDNLGNIHPFEIAEVDDVKISNNGVFNLKSASEDGTVAKIGAELVKANNFIER